MATPIEQLKPKIELTPDRNSILMRYLRTQVNGKEGWIPVTNEFTTAAPVAGLPTSSNYVVQGIQHTTDGALDGLYTGQALNWQVRRLLETPTHTPPTQPMTTTHALVGLDANQPINPGNGDISATINPDLAQNVQIVRINFIVGPYGSPTNPNWKAKYDDIVNRYISRGIQVYGLIGHEITNGHGAYLQVDQRSVEGEAWVVDYVNRFAEVVAHFRNRVKFWESYNEPSAYLPGGNRAVVHPYWFAKILKDVYQTVKFDRGMADVTLISGPLFAHTLGNDPIGNPNPISAQVNYLNDTFTQGHSRHGWTQFQTLHKTLPLDGLGYHLYVHERENVPSAILKATLENYLNQIYAAWKSNDGNAVKKKIYISEFGWQSTGMGEAQQKERMTTAFRVFLNDARVGAAIWFCTQEFNGEGWGIYPQNSLSQLKLAGLELRRIAAIARGSTGTGPIALNRMNQAMNHGTANGNGNSNGNAAIPHYHPREAAWTPVEDDDLAMIPVAERLAYVQDKYQAQMGSASAIARFAASDLVSVPVADKFQFPLGRPGRRLDQDFYPATFFLDAAYHSTSGTSDTNGIWHPGEDWNLITGGDSDLGEPVYAAANGKVITSGHFPTWGNIILIEHQLPNGDRVWTQYAHLNERLVFAGDIVERGNGIGTIGKGAHGTYSAHLHFEVRKQYLPAEQWRVNDPEYIRVRYHNPTAFVKAWQAPSPRWAHDVVVDSQESNQHAGKFSKEGTPQAWFTAPRGYLGRTLWSYSTRGEETNRAEWRPALRDGGDYEVFVYVPGENATTTNALYRITHADGEQVVSVNQNQLFDEWHPLGTFRFQVGNSGSVSLGNATGETDPRQVGFDAVRWVRLI